MNTLHFRYAVEIEKTRSITQAAENLFMAQPNLSKAIKELENTLGITIFRRTSKGVIPTEDGVKFIGYAKKVLIQIDNMEAIRSPESSGIRRLKLSAPRAGYISRAFSSLAAELASDSRTELQFAETGAMTAAANVRELGFGIGVIRFRTEHEKYFMDYLAEKSLGSQILWEFRAAAVMSERSVFADRADAELYELSEKMTEIVQGDDNVPYLSPLRPTEKGDITGKSRIFAYDRASIADILRASENTFFLTAPMSAEELSSSGLVQVKCRFEGNNYRDLLIYAEGHTFSELETELINRIYIERNKSAFL